MQWSVKARSITIAEKAKVLLLRMSLSGANVLILDEPTRNFSPLSGPVIRKMLREFPGAVISISHDRKYIEEVCDKIYQLKMINKESLIYIVLNLQMTELFMREIYFHQKLFPVLEKLEI